MWWEKESFDPLQTVKTKRIWHHYRRWEDAKNGMYASVTGNVRKLYLENAIDFTGDYLLYGKHMLNVVRSWRFSCEHNLSCLAINRRAWIGHAACCFALGVPEDITREAWGYLSNRQRRLANDQADIAIKTWERTHAKNTIGTERFGGSKGEDFQNVRPVQQDIFEFLRRQGFNGNASPCGR